jgi:hypothetical protein
MEYTETWPRCPEAARMFDEQFREFSEVNPIVAELATRFRDRAGVDLRNLVDHWVLPSNEIIQANLRNVGLIESRTADGDAIWIVAGARLPKIRLSAAAQCSAMAIAVDDVSHFLSVNWLKAVGTAGGRDSAFGSATVPLPEGELVVLARRGYNGFRPAEMNRHDLAALASARRDFTSRLRTGDERDIIALAGELFERHAALIGQARAVDEFFAAERVFYTARNRAAQWILRQQAQLGFGWANHDHHTYRSSRDSFFDLTNLWLKMGFVAREKFYAGAEAGWGAQVLEHPVSRVVIFADVDMAPEELGIDYSKTRLDPRSSLGTIGLWCALHTSSIAQAGMHHIECEFDFEAASKLFESEGFFVMKPFTDLPILKQRFTEAEIWLVPDDRLQTVLAAGAITSEQAAIFREKGAPGSHVEILQRWEGFKGFNKTGVSSIIRDTDARLAIP